MSRDEVVGFKWTSGKFYLEKKKGEMFAELKTGRSVEQVAYEFEISEAYLIQLIVDDENRKHRLREKWRSLSEKSKKRREKKRAAK